MPEHYAVMAVDTVIQAPLATYRYFDSPLDGFIQDLFFKVNSNIPTDAVLDVKINGVSIWAGDPTQRPKILAGQSSGQKLAVNAAIVKGDRITFDTITVPVGGLTVPFVTRAVLYDTIALRSSVIYITDELDDLEIENANIEGMGRSWKILNAECDRDAWVRGYVSNAARIADADRDITEDADENSGLCAEIIFESPAVLSIRYSSPFPEGYNDDDPQSTNGLFAIQNRSGEASTVQVVFQRLVIER
jgi:hypothetical protein